MGLVFVVFVAGRSMATKPVLPAVVAAALVWSKLEMVTAVVMMTAVVMVTAVVVTGETVTRDA